MDLSKPLSWFIPRQMHAYLAARQQEGQIDFRPINFVHLTVAWLSLIVLAAALVLCVPAQTKTERRLSGVHSARADRQRDHLRRALQSA